MEFSAKNVKVIHHWKQHYFYNFNHVDIFPWKTKFCYFDPFIFLCMIKVTGFHHRLIVNLWNSNIFEKSYECNYFNTDATSCAVTVRKPICLLVVFNLAGDWGRRGDRRDAHPFCYWWWWWKTWRSARPSWLQRLRTCLLRKSTGGGRDLLQYFLLLTFVSSRS